MSLKYVIGTIIFLFCTNLHAATVQVTGTVDAPVSTSWQIQNFFQPSASEVDITMSFDIERGANFNTPFDAVITDFSGTMSWVNLGSAGEPDQPMEIILSSDFSGFSRSIYQGHHFGWSFRPASSPVISGWELGGGVYFGVDNVFSDEAESIDFIDHLAQASFRGITLDARNDYSSASSAIYNNAVGQVVVSAVPVPATVWLFFSGLIGFMGISRRKKNWK